MRVIAKSTLKKFWEKPAYNDAKGSIESWYEETVKANWQTPQEVKAQYGITRVFVAIIVLFLISVVTNTD